MDESSLNLTSDCGRYIYSDDYIGYLIKSDNDLNGLEEIMQPDCVQIINNRFLVAYKESPGTASREELSGFFNYGYHNLPKLYTLMDVPAVEDIGAAAIKSIPGLNLDGSDVLIGFVDTGIDYANPAFWDATGKSRIEYIWDQNQTSYMVGEPVYGFGGEFSREDIEATADITVPGDEIGHGTFLASIAAGNESLEENFAGVAPAASMVMVKLRQAPRPLKEFYKFAPEDICYSEADIALGISYLIQKAVQLSKPMVICLGVGSTLGDHNGSSNLELYIENLSGLRGICFVAPVGNELGTLRHFAGNSPVGNVPVNDILRSEAMEINVESGVDGFVLEIWGNAPGLLKIILESPSGQVFDSIPPRNSGAYFDSFLFEGSWVFVENVVVDSLSGDQVYFLRFENPAQGIWRIYVQETINQLGAGFNAWITVGQSKQGRVSFIRSSPDITLTAPGSCQGVITVAAYNNDNNSIYVNSSRGYTRKGRVKPDITAPGVDIVGVFATGGASVGRANPLYSTRSGTSVAAAFAAGAAALMLQWGIVERNNLGINTEIIKQMLVRGANRQSGVVFPNNIWGWGKLDVLGAYEVSR